MRKLKATVVYISRSRSYSWSPAREQSDQRAERDLQAGQLSVLLIPLFSLINYSTLDSHRNTVISYAVMASKTVTRSSLLQCATVSEGVNRVIENNASDTLSLTDLKGHFY